MCSNKNSMEYENLLDICWNVSTKGLEIITSHSTIKDKSKIRENALNSDLKFIGTPVLNKEWCKHHIKNTILQIQKITNISAPKQDPDSTVAPRLLKLVLTDGESYINAIEMESLPSISRDKTAPGTKLLILDAKVKHGYLLLFKKNCKLLGGIVPNMHEKWLLMKNVAQRQNERNFGLTKEGPPKWSAFGTKIETNTSIQKNFRALDDVVKPIKENDSFEQQRQETISSITSGAVKKTFGAAPKLQPRILQAQNNSQKPYPRNPNFNRKERRRGRHTPSGDDEFCTEVQKPMQQLSLFDCIADKLPTQSSNSVPGNSQQTYNQFNNSAFNRNSNNFSNSYQNRNNVSKYNGRPQNSNQTTTYQDVNKLEKCWNIGDRCMAKYWEDGKFYLGSITLTADETCFVKFDGYDNIEEIHKSDCLPPTTSTATRNKFSSGNHTRKPKTYSRSFRPNK